MTKIQYKNWKTEIAWLRKTSNLCSVLSATFWASGNEAWEGFDKLAKSLSSRADSLEKAKGTAQAS